MADSTDIGMHNLRPAKGATRPRKRVGRGPASGTGKTSGRGHKGQKARSGSRKMRAGFEGGQNPLYMRVGKQRGSTKKMSMPMGPFRTETQPVNVASLDAFDAGTTVTVEMLHERGLVAKRHIPVKILGSGELSTSLTVQAQGFSATAREKIEKAGGTAEIVAPLRRAQAAEA